MNDAELERAARHALDPLRSPSAVAPMEDSTAELRAATERVAELVRSVPAVRRRWQRRRLAQVGGLAAAAAVAIGVGWGALFAGDEATAAGSAPSSADSALLLSGALEVNGRLLSQGQRVHGIAELETSEWPARLTTHAGVTLDVGAHTRASLNPSRQQPHIELMSGAMTFDVPPLPKGSTLRVVTPDATVTVIGTRFSVTHRSSGSDRGTCVRVLEGVVRVAPRDGASKRLLPGASFGCEQTERVAERREPAASEAQLTHARPHASPARSTLGQENRLLRDALAAERRGDRRTAVRKLSTLLRRYPNSPLALEARSQLARIRSLEP